MSPSFLQTLLNPILNASQDIRDITLHVVVVKSQKTQTQILQILLTHLITGRLLSMALTIYLDDESQLRAIEVHDVFVYWPLPQERTAQHFASLQLVPEKHFSQCAVVPEFPRSFLQFGVVVKHEFFSVLGC